MQLNEIIEENTLPSISKKTRISVQNLEALLDRNWGRLKKVQALGFISILEREYHLDLSDMRAECRAYFDEHIPEERELGPVISTVPDPEKQGFSKGLIALVILLAALGGYLLFFSPPELGNEKNTTGMMNERKSSFFDSVLTTAKGWFGRREEPETNGLETSDEEVPAVKGAWAEGNGNRTTEAEPTMEQTPEKAEGKQKEPAPSEKAGKEKNVEQNGSGDAEEARIIQQVKKEQAKAEEIRKQAAQEPAAPAEGEEKPLSNISKMILAATAGAASEENESGTAEGAAPETATKAETAAEAPEIREAPTAAAAPQQAVTDPLVVMHPRSKIWVGYTNLRTMKRSTKVTKEDITFDTAKGDYILAVGHGQIDFKTRNGEKKLNDGKRHFFMIARGDVREISHEEFQRLNKSKVW